MKYIVNPPTHQIDCTIKLPASKSISNRALILNALCENLEKIENVAICDDTNAMVKALSNRDANLIDIGAAGTAMRFLTAFQSMQHGKQVTIDGSARMRQRPIKILVDALRECGADIEYLMNEGFPPLKISGRKLTGGEIKLQGNVSSQYISALMMIAPLMSGGLKIELQGEVISLPYIEMTISLMKDFGVEANFDGRTITIPESQYKSNHYKVESDWSAASYWFEIQALYPNSKITLLGLRPNSVQGDSKVATYFEQLGVKTTFTPEGVVLSKGEELPSKLELDLVEQPDLAQTIITTACLLGVKFHIKGLSTLKIKETDRVEALRNELLKLGYVVNVDADFSMSWNGEKVQPKNDPSIFTYEDHRMAMAFAPAVAKFPGIIIEEPHVVTKSYPEYWNNLTTAGFVIQEK